MVASPPRYAIAVQDLCKSYQNAISPALDNLNLKVKRGEIFGLIGPNGAGKTTLISILCTLLQPDSGSARVWGYDPVKEAAEIRTGIGLVPQDIALYQSLTSFENLEYFGRVQKMRKNVLHSRIDECLAQVGLLKQRNQRVSRFSGGMKRRLNLAIGILHHPKILFLDEPTVGVDPQSRTLIFEQIEDLRNSGMTIVYTTHYMEEAEQLCGRVAIMDCGRIIGLDTVEKLIASKPECNNLEELFLALTGKHLRDS